METVSSTADDVQAIGALAMLYRIADALSLVAGSLRPAASWR
jgi:hypothetical protein